MQKLGEGIQAIVIQMFVTTREHRTHLTTKMHAASNALHGVITADKSLTSAEVAEHCKSPQGHHAEIESWTSKTEQHANQRVKAGEVVKRHLHKI
ncbi:hypothetical protein [Pandoraea apista]|uniref:hypothetical protein n=1 Tax=Pandoraea apista TaxID=93218 RepID=UPI00058AA6B6|nr:hypothetical protein [Pandoraea apista]AJE99560.1 hypothetical protein SG18_17570 [Pandoraea apista]AKH73681.1 hypothetical protein XM39_17765 [Pandoraea apista]AKI62230.1 hypothetical protein AA956_11080 [Pandoraea apista]